MQIDKVFKKHHEINKELNRTEKRSSIYCFSKPLDLQICLTNKCNLKCVMCKKVRELPSSLSYKAISKFWPIFKFIEKITWHGERFFW